MPAEALAAKARRWGSGVLKNPLIADALLTTRHVLTDERNKERVTGAVQKTRQALTDQRNKERVVEAALKTREVLTDERTKALARKAAELAVTVTEAALNEQSRRAGKPVSSTTAALFDAVKKDAADNKPGDTSQAPWSRAPDPSPRDSAPRGREVAAGALPTRRPAPTRGSDETPPNHYPTEGRSAEAYTVHRHPDLGRVYVEATSGTPWVLRVESPASTRMILEPRHVDDQWRVVRHGEHLLPLELRSNAQGTFDYRFLEPTPEQRRVLGGDVPVRSGLTYSAQQMSDTMRARHQDAMAAIRNQHA